MSAKEMFEKLGYELIHRNLECQLMYYNSRYDTYVYFYKTRKRIEFTNEITLEELQAINKQVEEFGWNNDNITN